MYYVYLQWVLGGIGVALIVLKVYIKTITGVYKGRERLDGKTVVVTGGNAGIGFLCCKDFAKRGAKVVMACRDMKKAEKAKQEIIEATGNNKIKIKHVDFASLKSVRKCANEILEEEPRIDILLNNAGAAEIGNKETEDGLDILMQINYFAPFLFTNILLKNIKQSTPSRIVSVSSILHNVGTLDLKNIKNPKAPAFVFLYGTSKIAIVYFTNELARKLMGTGVTVNCLHPGTFPSEIVRHNSSAFQILWNYILALFFRTTIEGSYTSIYACVAPELEKVTGAYFEECKIGETAERAKRLGAAKKLWELTEEAVNLQPSEKHY